MNFTYMIHKSALNGKNRFNRERGRRLPTLCYGTDTFSFTFPEGSYADWISYSKEPHDTNDPIQMALTHPFGTAQLAETARGSHSAVILISDISRLCPSYLFLEQLVTELNLAGITDGHITIIVALGMHRKQTDQELVKLVGAAIYNRIAVINHSPQPEDCILLGTTSLGTPIEINRHVVEADFRIVTGNLEPHALAGISGGVKALVPGTASSRCIEHNHALSQHYLTVIGDPENPVRKDMEEALQFLPVHFLLNVIVDHERKVIGAVAGDVIIAHRQGLELVRERFLVPVHKSYDLVIVSPGGHPKDSQMYQAVKALINASAITNPGGSLVLVAKCEEGLGNGLFQYWIETIQDRKTIMDKLNEKFVLGAHKIAHLDKVLQKHKVYLYSQLPEPIVQLIGFHPIVDLQDTINGLLAESSFRCAVMPYGGLTFPIRPDA
jgi:nickel-dependent lactate racemase